MKCPVDDVDLVMSERQGIEIDYCPKCRGVWLDRGELDKIIERSAAEEMPRGRDDSRSSYGDDRRHEQGQYRQEHRPYRKKKSLLGEIFDF